jgi:uncharacterized membrane protein
MMHFLRLLVGTIWLRPYVFAFLAVYLALAVPMWGWRRTIFFTIWGYGIAWLAEYSSIHNGFPFGPYSYISTPTIGRELWVLGVPFMDSLSFVFLAFAGLQTSRLLFAPLTQGTAGKIDYRWEDPSKDLSWHTWFWAGVLVMGLDIIIDPAALRGGRWFLGQIYTYPPGGLYFGVTIANFIGWAAVAWVIIGGFFIFEKVLLSKRLPVWRSYFGDALWGVGLYIGVLVFNLAVTFAIGEWMLGLVGVAISAILLAAPLSKLLHANQQEITMAEHIKE